MSKTTHIVDIRNFHLARRLAENREQADERMKELAGVFDLNLLGVVGCPAYEEMNRVFEDKGEAWGPYDLHGVLDADGEDHPTERYCTDFPFWAEEAFTEVNAPKEVWAVDALCLLSAEFQVDHEAGHVTFASWVNSFSSEAEFARTLSSVRAGAFARGVHLVVDQDVMSTELGKLCAQAERLVRSRSIPLGSYYDENSVRTYQALTSDGGLSDLFQALAGGVR